MWPPRRRSRRLVLRCLLGWRTRTLLLLLLLSNTVRGQHPPGSSIVAVETAAGRVEGLTEGDVQSFKGMPYAEPPLGPLRFAAAVPKRPWNGTRNAHTFGSTCIQGPDPQPSSHSEDCLFVNLWRPAQMSGTLAVMVFVHGGSFKQGTSSDPLYDGSALAQHGVIVVSLNYRLGAWGFLGVTGSDAGTGKMNGINDMIAALQWVQNNVASFGGSPDDVTLFSESAGAIAACVLCFSPRSQGLFQRTILESGVCTAQSLWGERPDPDTSQSRHPVSALRTMTVAEVNSLCAGASIVHCFPALDGWVLSGQPLALMGQLHVDSILLGGNSFDSLAPFVPEVALPASSWAWREWMMAESGLNGFTLSTATQIMEQYTPSRYLRTADGEPFYTGSLAQCDADLVIVCPQLWFARELVRAGKSARVYHFSYGPACSDVARLMWADGSFPYSYNLAGGPQEPGTDRGWASHIAELPFVFDAHLHSLFSHDLVPDCSFGDGAQGQTPRRLVQAMQQLWTSFAKTGVPHTDPALLSPSSAGGGGGDEQWPVWSLSGDAEPVMAFSGSRIGIVASDFKARDCSLLHEHVHGTASRFLPWFEGLIVAIVPMMTVAGAVHRRWLPMPTRPLPANCCLKPRQGEGAFLAPIPAAAACPRCEHCMHGGTALLLCTATLATLLPWIAPFGGRTMAAALALLAATLLRARRRTQPESSRRDGSSAGQLAIDNRTCMPRVRRLLIVLELGLASCGGLLGVWVSNLILVFSFASVTADTRNIIWGDHVVSSWAALLLSALLLPLFVCVSSCMATCIVCEVRREGATATGTGAPLVPVGPVTPVSTMPP